MITQYDIYQLQSTEELLKLKNKIKDSVITPMTWQKRMELYSFVQLINKRITLFDQ